jgi:hypothetical protein
MHSRHAILGLIIYSYIYSTIFSRKNAPHDIISYPLCGAVQLPRRVDPSIEGLANFISEPFFDVPDVLKHVDILGYTGASSYVGLVCILPLTADE